MKIRLSGLIILVAGLSLSTGCTSSKVVSVGDKQYTARPTSMVRVKSISIAAVQTIQRPPPPPPYPPGLSPKSSPVLYPASFVVMHGQVSGGHNIIGLTTPPQCFGEFIYEHNIYADWRYLVLAHTYRLDTTLDMVNWVARGQVYWESPEADSYLRTGLLGDNKVEILRLVDITKVP